jgi:plastocyanin
MRRSALIAVCCLVVAACGGSSKSSSSSSSGGGSSTLAIAADPGGALKFTSSSLTAKAGKVTVDFTNKSSVPHGVVITGNGVNAQTSVVSAGEAKTTVTLKPGKYTFYCPVGNHRAEGMEGTLTVS